MTKKQLLEEAILKITRQAGLETSGTFHLTSVSQDFRGLFIMEVLRPERKRLCEEVKRAVTGFPSDTESGCIALLPEVVDGIILAAQSNRAVVLPVSGCTVAGKALMERHYDGDESVTNM